MPNRVRGTEPPGHCPAPATAATTVSLHPLPGADAMRRSSLRLPALGNDPEAPFPSPDSALREPDGLLAIGGDLSPARLLNAYSHGIFPWYSDDQPILWWSPDPRMVFRSDGV